jgi:hypothetical protein
VVVHTAIPPGGKDIGKGKTVMTTFSTQPVQAEVSAENQKIIITAGSVIWDRRQC